LGRSGARQGWLYGPVTDLSLGCGLAYFFMAAVHLASGSRLSDAVPGGILILLFSLPHYGATLMRVYASAEDRAKYRLLAVHATGLLVVLLALGAHTAWVGSFLLTLYLTWSPWHYTGQNYGISLMLARRRGVEVAPDSKQWLYVSFVASYALAFFAMHGSQSDAAYAPVSHAAGGIRFLSLGIPHAIASWAIRAAGAIYVAALLGAAAVLLRKGGSIRALGPVAMLVVTQAAWFVMPVFLRSTGWLENVPGSESPFSAYGFLWIASAHAVQYLWITVYFATAGSGGVGRWTFLGKSALVGFAVWTLPGLAFAPQIFGGTTYDSGLALLVASVVNLHHFILDGAIWKLRDGRIAQVLLRSAPSAPTPPIASNHGLLRGLGWAAGILSVAVAAVGFWESEFGFRRAISAGDLDRARVAIQRFAWLGRDGASKRNWVARELASRGDYAGAEVQLGRALAIESSGTAHELLGLVREQQQRWGEALREYEASLAIVPDNELTRERRAAVFIELGDPASAATELEGVLASNPRNDRARALLVRARLALRGKQPGGRLD